MSTLNDLDVGTPLPGATMDSLAAEIRQLKAVLKGVLLHSHKPNGAINGTQINELSSGSVGTIQLVDGCVTVGKLGDGSVTSVKLSNGAVTSAKIGNGVLIGAHFSAGCIPGTAFQVASIPLNALATTISGNYIASNAITTAHLVNGAVTDAKIGSMAFAKLTGTAADGAILQFSTANGWEAKPMPTISGFSVAFFGELANGNGGNAATADTWYKRSISLISDGSPAFLTITSSEISVPVGTYLIQVRCPAYAVDNHQIRLVRKTVADSTTTVLAVGSTAYSAAAALVQTDSFLTYVLDEGTEGTYTYYFEHYFKTVGSADDYGVDANNGVDNLYTSGYIIKLPG